VGSPALAGTSTFVNATFTVSAAGADIWGTSDQFRYTYQQHAADLDLVAKVVSLQNTNPWTKGGVMIRNSLNANSAHASLFVTPSNGIAFQYRVSSGSTTMHVGATGQAPVWLKLQRRGSTITGFRSADGASWTQIGQVSFGLTSTFHAGLAVTSHDVERSTTAVFTNVAVTAPGASNQPPIVSLTNPANGTTYTAGTSIAMTATASDPDGSVARVEFYSGATLLGSDTTSPYAYTWNGAPAGSHSLTALAVDQQGLSTRSAARAITVTSSVPNQSPSVSLTSPASGAVFTLPTAIGISANAGDTDGTVTVVEFYAGSTLIGSDTSSPYSVTWSNATPGTHSLTAVARDNAGAMTVSAARSIRVDSAQLPRTAVFVPSTNHATAVQRYELRIFPVGVNPSAGNPVATQDLGKPAVVNGECSSDISQTTSGLAPGNYIATVSAVGPGGTAQSAPSAQFTR
jgi:hypothetical protein